MLFRPIYPPHRLLHQQDNRSATLQLVDVRNVPIPRSPIRSLVHVYNCEGFEEAKELPDETGERRGLFKLEFLEDHVRTLNVHPKLAPSTGLVAIGINLYVIKDELYIQHWRLVVGDPMDTFVEETSYVLSGFMSRSVEMNGHVPWKTIIVCSGFERGRQKPKAHHMHRLLHIFVFGSCKLVVDQ